MQTQDKKTKKCTPERALFSLVTSYATEQIHDAFDDVENMFKQWSCTEWADQRSTREDFVFSLQIIAELGAVVRGISPKKIKALKEELELAKAQLTK